MAKRSIRVVFLPILLTMFGACSDKERVTQFFDASPIVRLEEAREKWYDELQSAEHGWKFVYFPLVIDNPATTRRNQFTYLFRFQDGNQVTMEASNHGAELATSEYDIALGATLKLRFVTYNFIHELSDASNSGSYGTGGRSATGDFEFYFYGKEGDDLLMRTNRKNVEVRFERATAADWGGNKEPLRDSLIKHFAHRNYRLQTFLGADLIGDSLARIDLAQRHLSLFSVAGSDTTQTARSGVGYGVNGVVVMPALKLADKEFYFFKWHQQERKLVSTVDDRRVEIVVSP